MRVHEVLPHGTLILHLAFFYLFSLSIFYCFLIDYCNLFLLLYKFSIFYPFLLNIFYCYPINHSNFFYYYIKYGLFLTIRPKVIHYKMDYILKVDQTLWKTQAQLYLTYYDPSLTLLMWKSKQKLLSSYKLSSSSPTYRWYF